MKKLSKKGILKAVYKDPERKPLFKIIYEIIYLTFYHQSYAGHYFSRFLFKKEQKNIKDYYPNAFLKKTLKPFNDRGGAQILISKLFFDLYYRDLISVPKTFMYSHKDILVMNGNGTDIKIDSLETFKNLLINFFKENSKHSGLIIKMIYGTCEGEGIYLIKKEDLEINEEKIATIYKEVIKYSFLFQEIVEQHDELNKLNDSCLNTMRMDTFVDKDGNIEILSAFIRMSFSGSFKDNVAAGGCFAKVNLKDGKLGKHAYKGIYNGLDFLTEHPVSKTVFEGFEIPHFNEVKNLVIKAASLIPNVRSVGWDVAVSKNGPVLIEGNPGYNVNGNDFIDGGYAKNKIFQKILKEYNELQA